MPISNSCAFCDSHEETMDHVFLNCPSLLFIWNFFGDSVSLNFRNGPNLEDRVKAKPQWGLTKIRKIYAHLCFHILTWGLWLERNRILFYREKQTNTQIVRDIKSLIWSWGLGNSEGRKIRKETIMFIWFSGKVLNLC